MRASGAVRYRAGGQIFTGPRGGIVAEWAYLEVFHAARQEALIETEAWTQLMGMVARSTVGLGSAKPIACDGPQGRRRRGGRELDNRSRGRWLPALPRPRAEWPA